MSLLLAATQEHRANVWMRQQRLAGVLVAILPHGQDIATVGTLQGLAGVLFYDEHGDTSAMNVNNLFEHHPNQQWRQASRRLVQEQQSGVEHERPGHRHHLPLATATPQVTPSSR